MFEESKGSEKNLESQLEELRRELRETQKKSSNPNLIPGAVIIAGLIIAGAIFYQSGGSSSSVTNVTPNKRFSACLESGKYADKVNADYKDALTAGGQGTPYSVIINKSGKKFPINGAQPYANFKTLVDKALADAEDGSKIDDIRPVSDLDHIRGDINAPVKIVEFSDLECPFCKSIHPTLQRIYEEYGKNGRVAWVYRHFPLAELHPKASKEAEASECAAELGGNDKFWAYIDRIFEITPSNNQLDPLLLVSTANYVGIK